MNQLSTEYFFKPILGKVPYQELFKHNIFKILLVTNLTLIK